MSIPALNGTVECNKFLCFNLFDIDRKKNFRVCCRELEGLKVARICACVRSFCSVALNIKRQGTVQRLSYNMAVAKRNSANNFFEHVQSWVSTSYKANMYGAVTVY